MKKLEELVEKNVFRGAGRVLKPTPNLRRKYEKTKQLE